MVLQTPELVKTALSLGWLTGSDAPAAPRSFTTLILTGLACPSGQRGSQATLDPRRFQDLR
jgi:hypothetical protein